MATIILFCLGVAYAIVGVFVFFFALINGQYNEAFMGLFFAPLLLWPATLIIAVIVFLVMKSRHELRR